MRVLVACEFSGIVRDAFRARGHDAWSCDLLPSESTAYPFYHIQGDVLKELQSNRWDLIIAHPPCTYLCNSGVRWLYERSDRPYKMEQAAIFFRQILFTDCAKICIENPIPHKYAVSIIGKNYDQIIQPWQFGHGETKATCLWLKGLPPLQPTNIVEGRESRVHRMPPGPDRWKERSRTFKGVAEAMAAQWG